MSALKFALVGMAAVTLASCGTTSAPQADPVTKCMLHTNAPGKYVYESRNGADGVVVGEGGTQAGAAAINDCIRQSTNGMAPQQYTTVAGGDGTTTRTYTYGTPPAN